MKKIAIALIFICGLLLTSPARAVKSNFHLNLKVISVRADTLDHYLYKPIQVLIILLKINGKDFRVVNLMRSTPSKTVGKIGATIEIAEWHGSYYPATVLYQMPITRILAELIKIERE